MSYDPKRCDGLRRAAMTLIHNADTNLGGAMDMASHEEVVEYQQVCYARAAAYLALERNEQASGQISVNQTVDKHFDTVGDEL